VENQRWRLRIPEVVILSCKKDIGTLQRLGICFEGTAIANGSSKQCHRQCPTPKNPKIQIQYGGQKPEVVYISASNQDFFKDFKG